MDNQNNQQTNTDPYQQGNAYQQGNSYQQNNAYQQNGAYQQGSPYQQGNAYQQGNFYQQGNPYQQGNAYQQGNPYQQGNAYQQGNPYQQGNAYQQGHTYQQGNVYGGNGGGNYGGNSEPQKAPNIFQQFAFSFVPNLYDRLAKVRTGSMIGFVTLLVLAATLLSFLTVVIEVASVDMEKLSEELPEFTLTGGRLYMEEDFLYDEGNIFVYMTEDIDGFTYDDAAEMMDEGYRDVMLVGRDRISIMQNGEYQQLDFSNLSDSFEISREWIATKLAPFIMVVVVLVYIVIFLWRVLWYFLCAAVYLLFAMLIASVMKKQVPEGVLFRTAVYAKVLMFVVGTFLDLIPFVDISVPFLLRVVITILFMGFAIAKLPDSNPTPAPMMGQGWQ